MANAVIILFMVSILIFQQLIYRKLDSLENKSTNIENEFKRTSLKVELLNNSVRLLNWSINSPGAIKK